MMKLITWNIQWGLGIDKRVDLARIVREARNIADFDVLCLQELSSNWPELPHNDGADQFAQMTELLPGYTAIPIAALDMGGPDGRRKTFGNMVFSRYPVGTVTRHTLPWTSRADLECMPRALLDVVVTAPWGPVRVMTTHLEWTDPVMREPQVEMIRQIHRQSALRALTPPRPGKWTYLHQPGSVSAILTGDFNMKPDEPLVARLQEAYPEPGVPRLVDSFAHLHPGKAHPFSMCLYVDDFLPPCCLDYIMVTEDLLPRVRKVHYDQKSKASDHQPVLIELGD
jgi:endonuclease/exonuclease/phosphatase family metal-dependent hydrolase